MMPSSEAGHAARGLRPGVGASPRSTACCPPHPCRPWPLRRVVPLLLGLAGHRSRPACGWGAGPAAGLHLQPALEGARAAVPGPALKPAAAEEGQGGGVADADVRHDGGGSCLGCGLQQPGQQLVARARAPLVRPHHHRQQDEGGALQPRGHRRAHTCSARGVHGAGALACQPGELTMPRASAGGTWWAGAPGVGAPAASPPPTSRCAVNAPTTSSSSASSAARATKPNALRQHSGACHGWAQGRG